MTFATPVFGASILLYICDEVHSNFILLPRALSNEKKVRDGKVVNGNFLKIEKTKIFSRFIKLNALIMLYLMEGRGSRVEGRAEKMNTNNG